MVMIFIFLVLMTVYSLIAENRTDVSEIPISEVAADVSRGDVAASKIAGDGFTYWFMNLAPFIIPILFIAVFIWFLTRQVKGAGMQAFTFGQSKPRIIL